MPIHRMYLPRLPGTASACGRRPSPMPRSSTVGSDVKKLELPPYFQILAPDSYDNCLAYLDEQLGELFEELERRGELDRTLVIVTSDHGEGLGEHGLFDHGESLYRTEIQRAALDRAASAQPVSRGCERDRQPSQSAGDDRRTRRPGGQFALSRPVAGQAVAGIFTRCRFGHDRWSDLRADRPQSNRSESRVDRRPSGAR